MIRRVSFSGAVVLPPTFLVDAQKLVNAVSTAIDAGERAGASVATLRSVLALKVKSLQDVQSGALAPERWVSVMNDLLSLIDQQFVYVASANSLTANAKAQAQSMLDAVIRWNDAAAKIAKKVADTAGQIADGLNPLNMAKNALAQMLLTSAVAGVVLWKVLK